MSEKKSPLQKFFLLAKRNPDQSITILVLGIILLVIYKADPRDTYYIILGLGSSIAVVVVYFIYMKSNNRLKDGK